MTIHISAVTGRARCGNNGEFESLGCRNSDNSPRSSSFNFGAGRDLYREQPVGWDGRQPWQRRVRNCTRKRRLHLRAAIEEANTLGAGNDTIILPPNTYLLTLVNELTITGDLTISGGGASTTIIDGNKSVRPASGVLVVISGITVSISGVLYSQWRKRAPLPPTAAASTTAAH